MRNEIQEDICKLIRRKRKEKHMTQVRLAAELQLLAIKGATRSRIVHIETEFYPVRADELIAISGILSITPEDLENVFRTHRAKLNTL